jgi:hypothetical protein
MRFTGRAIPQKGAATVLKATTTAPSSSLTTIAGPEGVRGSQQRVAGEQGSFESQVTFTGESAFQEAGTITFGEHGHRVRFSTMGQGYVGASPGAQARAGDLAGGGGEGQFAGARGLITSNCFVGEVTDHHFGIIFVE